MEIWAIVLAVIYGSMVVIPLLVGVLLFGYAVYDLMRIVYRRFWLRLADDPQTF